MKIFLALLFSIGILSSLTAQNLALPFFDDFEETIVNDAIFTKWTSENVAGWNYWHIIPWNGNPGQCMRFQNCDTDQNDWLITKAINCAGAENLKVNFSHLFHTKKVPPRLYYTNQYNGDASQSVWTELSYTFGANADQWYPSEDFIINNPGNVIYFAFHYQAAANEGAYFLLDNFSVINYTPVVYEKVGDTEHFEFYTSIAGESGYWLEMKDKLEANYEKYWEAIMAPGWSPYLEAGVKIKIYYTEKENVPMVTEDTPDIKSGFFDRTNSIYLTPLNNGEKTSYYTNLEGLAVHSFAGFIKQKQFIRDKFPVETVPAYFYEAFGLFEQGYRTRHDSILGNKANHPEKYTVQELNSMDVFKNTSDRDIIISYLELDLIGGGYWNWPPDEGREVIWNNYLTYFHDTTEVVQIKKYGVSEYFDIYCSSRDTMFMDSLKVWLERTRQFWVDSFQVQINNRFGLIILFDEKTGMDMTGFDRFNGGAGGLVISPHYWGIESYPWLLAHEFSHTFSIRFGGWTPNGFYQEGLANFVGYKLYGRDWMESKWQIGDVFNYYEQNFDREPTMDEFAFDPHRVIDPYFFGLQFFRYMETFCSHTQIRNFFNGALDFWALGKSKDEVESGYIDYLKSLIEIQTKLPEVVTSAATIISENSASLRGDVLSDGDAIITQRGFYWSQTNTTPGTSDHTELVSGTTGSFSKIIENLSPESTYYYRAFATNSEGTSLGSVKEFTTNESTTNYAELPFFDDFSKDYANWTTYSVTGNDQWHISGDDGIDFGKCARFYVTSNPPQANDDWLVSQVFNTKEISNLTITFKYLYSTDGPSPEFYYTTSVNGNPTDTEWTHIDKSFWHNSIGWQDAKIEIDNPGETFVFAVRYHVTASDPYYYYLMDNLNIEGIITNSGITKLSLNDFKIYPNPLTQESIISFSTKTNGNVSLSLYDLQGREICTLIDNNLVARNHTIPVGNQIRTSGVYICKLITPKGISTKKLIVK